MRPDCFRTYRFRFALGCGVLITALAGCHQQMGDGPYYKPLEKNDLAGIDGKPMSSSRDLVANTVPRGSLRDDDLLFTGKVSTVDANGQIVKTDSNEFPFTITEEVIRRGQARYNIYCSPCHGALGDGNGMIAQRGRPALTPVNFHSEKMTTSPVGHYFDVVTNGFGKMYSQSERIQVRDRWAIIAYIRALQLSQNFDLALVSEAERTRITGLADTSTTPSLHASATPNRDRGHAPTNEAARASSTGGSH